MLEDFFSHMVYFIALLKTEHQQPCSTIGHLIKCNELHESGDLWFNLAPVYEKWQRVTIIRKANLTIISTTGACYKKLVFSILLGL